jgi:hypothetical protein
MKILPIIFHVAGCGSKGEAAIRAEEAPEENAGVQQDL